jgi:hypothetical protein
MEAGITLAVIPAKAGIHLAAHPYSVQQEWTPAFAGVTGSAREVVVLEIEDSRPVAVTCDAEHLHVTLADGRAISAPLWWYPRLHRATPSDRQKTELMPMGIHWPAIDEDISIASILRGEKAPGASKKP